MWKWRLAFIYVYILFLYFVYVLKHFSDKFISLFSTINLLRANWLEALHCYYYKVHFSINLTIPIFSLKTIALKTSWIKSENQTNMMEHLQKIFINWSLTPSNIK